jgi:integrase
VALKDAMDLAYLTGQRPGDTRSLTDHDIIDGYLVIKQSKTSAALRFIIEGELKALLDRIEERKRSHKTWSANLLVSQYGKAMSKQMLRKAFETARSDAADEADKSGNAALAAQIRAFWFYDLRAQSCRRCCRRTRRTGCVQAIGAHVCADDQAPLPAPRH